MHYYGWLVLFSPAQFKHGTALDRLMTLISLLLAIVHGAVLPLSTLLLGNIIDLLVNQATTQDVYTSIGNNLSIALESFVFVTDANLTSVTDAIETQMLDQGLLASEENFIELLTFLLGEQGSINTVQNISCLVYTYANESSSSAFHVLSSIVNETASIVASEENCACISGIFEAIGISELRCISVIRLLYDRAILRQDIGWFDLNSSGELNSRMSE